MCVDATHTERVSERTRKRLTKEEGAPLHKIHGRQLRMASLVVTLNENNSRNKSAASDLVDSVFAIFGITQNDRKRARAHHTRKQHMQRQNEMDIQIDK